MAKRVDKAERFTDLAKRLNHEISEIVGSKPAAAVYWVCRVVHTSAVTLIAPKAAQTYCQRIEEHVDFAVAENMREKFDAQINGLSELIMKVMFNTAGPIENTLAELLALETVGNQALVDLVDFYDPSNAPVLRDFLDAVGLQLAKEIAAELDDRVTGHSCVPLWPAERWNSPIARITVSNQSELERVPSSTEPRTLNSTIPDGVKAKRTRSSREDDTL